jgi:two-component system sensor histidine kinase ChvG
MAASVEDERIVDPARASPRLGLLRDWLAGVSRFFGIHAFSSITRRIIVLNLAALLVLLSGILYLNQFRAGLIDARVASLLTQGEIIAGAIAASATVDTSDTITIDPEQLLALQAGESIAPSDRRYEGIDFPINPERVAPILRRLVSPTRTRARIYDRDGVLVVDSRHLYSRGQILRFDLPAPADEKPSLYDEVVRWVKVWLQRGDLPIYEELGGSSGKGYPEVVTALGGSATSIVRITDRGELIVSVAVPIQRYRSVVGSLLLSTQGGDIDAIVHAERMAILRVFLVAAGVTILLSILLAGTIAAPLRRLADAADRVRRGMGSRPQIPEFPNRDDEIGHLARALREMTNALYNRIEAIESFAADVAHEIKNPLTSLRSATETLPLAKTEDAKARLSKIIQHDVRRLDRLISDISNASRLDAELARQDAGPVDLSRLLTTVVNMMRSTTPEDGPTIRLDIAPAPADAYFVHGHDGRLGQVFNNLIDNARSFCRKDGVVRVAARPVSDAIEVVVEDDGPGIRPDQFERIFERFYTDRSDQEDSFGQNSGLGLSITKQIVEAHRGRITAENRTRPAKEAGAAPVVLGARFVVRLPVE